MGSLIPLMRHALKRGITQQPTPKTPERAKPGRGAVLVSGQRRLRVHWQPLFEAEKPVSGPLSWKGYKISSWVERLTSVTQR